MVAIIGDGALTGGLAYEALNNAGRSRDNLIVVLNDNEMSISKNVGSMARYLTRIRTKPAYFRLKAALEKNLNRIPLVGYALSNFLFRFKSSIKRLIYGTTLFEDIGFRYMGPIDGHNLDTLCSALESAKMSGRPVLLHINTVKGKGYDFAERDPSQFHGVARFDINTGEPVMCSGDNFPISSASICVNLPARMRTLLQSPQQWRSVQASNSSANDSPNAFSMLELPRSMR